MSETNGRSGTSNVRSLTDAIRKARVAESERTDVVVELREAERARLDMLADELRNVFAEIPDGDEQFIFQISGGTQPRLWIDMTSLVMMARDRRTYRFVKDTRFGRTVILETADLDDMADCVTQYVAERIIERERALEADWLAERILRADEPQKADKPASERRAALLRKVRDGSVQPAGHQARSSATMAAVAFLGGLLVGVAALLAYAWFKIG